MPVFEPAKRAFDDVSQLVGIGVERVSALPRRVVRDNRKRAALAQEQSKAIAVISRIGGAQACWRQQGEQRQDGAKIAALSGCYFNRKRSAPPVDDSVDLGRTPASRAPDRLLLRPPFPPAAER